MSDPDPCPFCGGVQPHVLDNTVECAYCDAEGPYSVSSKEAVKAWDRRPAVEQARRDGIAWALKRLREWAPKGTVLRIELATVADRLWQEVNGE